GPRRAQAGLGCAEHAIDVALIVARGDDAESPGHHAAAHWVNFLEHARSCCGLPPLCSVPSSEAEEKPLPIEVPDQNQTQTDLSTGQDQSSDPVRDVSVEEVADIAAEETRRQVMKPHD